MRKLAFLILAASAAVSSVPASAQTWVLRPTVRSEIRADINQLQNQIQRSQRNGRISEREATGLRRQAANVRQLLARYSRNGLSRAEVATLEMRVNDLRQRLRLERRDWDGRRG
ncbi:MAG TPA: hypothetical protein VF631_14655 [Allosphingosinicella sp.]|jgi:hypothetical protein|uniref:hypothetical protein n=1 Tax=Allosphingosinicella sp. TaxID=2823234 RepID=UPI002F2AD137